VTIQGVGYIPFDIRTTSLLQRSNLRCFTYSSHKRRILKIFELQLGLHVSCGFPISDDLYVNGDYGGFGIYIINYQDYRLVAGL
jgi:hypothetical protein